MAKITTKTLLGFLPFDSKFKLEILEKYDSMPPAEKQRITDLVWDAYCDYYDLKVKENFDRGVVEASKRGEKTGSDFYGKVVDKTTEEIENALTSASETADLSEARKSMEQIVKAIKSSKTPASPTPAATKAN